MADLITVQDYKDLAGLESLKEDPRLTLLVASVSQMVKTYCANSFVDYFSSDKTEYFNVDFDTHILQLTESPVVSVTSVSERANYETAYVALTTGAFEYYLDTYRDSIFRTTGSGSKNWAKGPGAVKVLYKAGYATIPTDLKLAVADLIRYYHEEEYKDRRTLAGASITNKTTSSQVKNVGFPDHIKRVLDLYKNIQL